MVNDLRGTWLKVSKEHPRVRSEAVCVCLVVPRGSDTAFSAQSRSEVVPAGSELQVTQSIVNFRVECEVECRGGKRDKSYGTP